MSEESLRILVIGQGAREHALGWKLRAEGHTIYTSPGNAGTEQIGENVPFEDFPQIVDWAGENQIDLTVVGPEDPIVAGIGDSFREAGLNIFAPSKQAAQLEGSKAYGVEFMQKHNIPHPASVICTTAEEAFDAIEQSSWQNIVVKADGLAAGKGVVVADSPDEARDAVNKLMVQRIFGKAGDRVVLQERLSGSEISVLTFSDGTHTLTMPLARDHKRLLDRDEGPNTGGMGAIAPVPHITQELIQQIQDTIVQPTIDGMNKEETPFVGMLFTGVMLTDKGPIVIEYNVRFGDPEILALLLLLDSELAPLLVACIQGKLNEYTAEFSKDSAACVVVAAENYPVNPVKGVPIKGVDTVPDDIQVFHAGTTRKGQEIVTNGGRVFALATRKPTLPEALESINEAIDKNNGFFPGAQHRRDIGESSLRE